VSRLPALPPAVLTDEQRALYSEIAEGPRASGPQHFALTADDGSLQGPFNAFLFSPRLGHAIQELGAAVRFSTELTARTREIAILIVAARWHSAFERQAHEGVGRAIGLTETELTELRAGRIPELADTHENAAAHLVYAMARGDVSDAQWQRWASVVGNATAFELSTLVGYYATLALQLRVFRVDEQPDNDQNTDNQNGYRE
jgi:4-carboxymuconolactone decarboxylase